MAERTQALDWNWPAFKSISEPETMDVLLNLSKPCDSSSALLRITMPVSRIVVFGQSILAPNTGVHIVGAQLIVTSSVIVVIMVITESVLSQYSHSFNIYFLSTCCNTC